jgi:arsenate reductase (glutaredoxin)
MFRALAPPANTTSRANQIQRRTKGMNSVRAAVGIDNLIDREGRTYAEKNLKYLIHDSEEELLKDPMLLKTPVVRNGREATAGYQPEIWKEWK